MRNILRSKPLDMEINFQLALILGKKKDLSGCIDHFTRVLQLAPANVHLKASIAINYWSFGIFDMAFDLFYSLGIPDLPGEIRNHLISMIQQKEQQKYFIHDPQIKAMELIVLRIAKKAVGWSGQLTSDWEVNELTFALTPDWQERYEKTKTEWGDSSDIMTRILNISQKADELMNTENIQRKIEWFETQKKLWNSKELDSDLFHKALRHFETFILAKIEGSKTDFSAVLTEDDFDSQALAEIQRFYAHKRLLLRSSDQVYANLATAFHPFILIDEMALRGLIYRGEELWCKEHDKDKGFLWQKLTSIRKQERITGFNELADCVKNVIEKMAIPELLKLQEVIINIKSNFAEYQKKRMY